MLEWTEDTTRSKQAARKLQGLMILPSTGGVPGACAGSATSSAQASLPKVCMNVAATCMAQFSFRFDVRAEIPGETQLAPQVLLADVHAVMQASNDHEPAPHLCD